MGTHRLKNCSLELKELFSYERIARIIKNQPDHLSKRLI